MAMLKSNIVLDVNYMMADALGDKGIEKARVDALKGAAADAAKKEE